MALTWKLGFEDALSGPAKKAASGVGALSKEFEALQRSINTANAAQAKFVKTATTKAQINKTGMGTFADGRALSGAGGKLPASTRMMQGIARTFGPGAVANIGRAAAAYERFGPALASVARFGAMAAASLAAVGMAAAAGIYKVGSYVRDAQSFRQSSQMAFEQLLGSKKAADAAIKAATRIAFDTGADLRETIGSMNSLIAQGFDVKFADNLIRAMRDLKTLNPVANMEGIVRAISQIKSIGRLQGDELMQLAEAGLPVAKVYEEIAKGMGLVDKEGETAAQQVQKLQAAGKISSDMAIKGIMDAVKASTKAEAGKVATAKADKTLEGTIARIKVLRDELAMTMGVDWSPLQSAAAALLEVMKSPAAKEFSKAIGDGLSAIMKALFADMTAGDLEAGLRSMTKAVGEFVETTVGIIEFAKAMREVYSAGAAAADGIDSLGSVIPFASEQLAIFGSLIKTTVLGPVLGLIDAIAEVGNGIKAASEALGGNIIEGIVQGIKAGAARVAEAVSGAAKGAINEAKGVLGIASPSKVFRGMGTNLMQSQALGVREEAPRLRGAVQSASAGAIDAGQALARSITQNSTTNAQSVSIGTMNVGQGAPNAGSIGGAVADAFRGLFLSHG
jgi:tape measure domain-containing protein